MRGIKTINFQIKYRIEIYRIMMKFKTIHFKINNPIEI